MIAVEFQSVGSGTCGWCRTKRDEVFTVAFTDQSFVGPMCRADLLRAVGMKLGKEAPQHQAASPAITDGSAAT